MYQLVRDSDLIRRTTNDSYFSPSNTFEYTEYQEWLASGNVPDPPQPMLELPGYQKFWDLLLISNIYQKVLQQSFTSLPVNTACTVFIAAFTDAKLGNPNIPAIQQCIYLLIQHCDFKPADIAELRDLLKQAKLNKVFTLTLPV